MAFDYTGMLKPLENEVLKVFMSDIHSRSFSLIHIHNVQTILTSAIELSAIKLFHIHSNMYIFTELWVAQIILT